MIDWLSMPYLFTILDDGGRSLYIKTQGHIKTPAFPTVGLLTSLASYTETCGYDLRGVTTHDVKLVYAGFPNGLLFVLATCNLLLTTEQHRSQLQLFYEALRLLLGTSALSTNTPSKANNLRRRLKGISSLVESLLPPDHLAPPCPLLHVPQAVVLASRDKSELQSALKSVAQQLDSELGAIIMEGVYCCATSGWWELSSTELLILQLVAERLLDEVTLSDTPVYLSLHKYGTASRLVCATLLPGVQVLLVVGDKVLLHEVEAVVRERFMHLTATLQAPMWGAPTVPQVAPLPFDVALMVERGLPCACLLWGLGAATPPGFNPLMSPSLRRQLTSSASPVHLYQLRRDFSFSATDTPLEGSLSQLLGSGADSTRRVSRIAVEGGEGGQAGGGAAGGSANWGGLSPRSLQCRWESVGGGGLPLQMFVTRLLDLLLAFATMSRSPHHEGQGGGGTRPSTVHTSTDNPAGQASMVVGDVLLVALMDGGSEGADCFMATTRTPSMTRACETAVQLRSAYLMSCRSSVLD